MPAQDALAELYFMEHNCLVGTPDTTDMPPLEYINKVIEALLQIERHWQRGRRRKLNPEVVILHEEIFGLVPRQFSSVVLKAAQALFDYMDKEVQGRGATAEVLEGFAEKVREVRAQYLANGWLAGDSLAFGYLMAHAERCGQGCWGEEEQKHRLPVWTPSCAEFRNNHRAIADALKPLPRLMMDFAEKWHTMDILSRLKMKD